MLPINHAICLHFPQAKIGNVTSIAVSKLHTYSRYLPILRMIVNFHSNERRPTTNKIETENNQHAVQYTITYVLTNECFHTEQLWLYSDYYMPKCARNFPMESGSWRFILVLDCVTAAARLVSRGALQIRVGCWLRVWLLYTNWLNKNRVACDKYMFFKLRFYWLELLLQVLNGQIDWF